MNAPRMPKIVNVLPPAAIVDDADFVFNPVDTKGFAFARFIFQLGAIDIDFATRPKIQHDDELNAGHLKAAADIDGKALAAVVNTDDNKLMVIDVPLDGGTKRYLEPAAKGGNGAAGTYMSAICLLYGAKIDLGTAAGAGLLEWIK